MDDECAICRRRFKPSRLAYRGCFIRNKVWDYLHGFEKEKVETNDIDLVYFDTSNQDEEKDKELSEKLTKETGINWEVVNEAYAHKWNNLPPYKSIENAISLWPETATSIGIRKKGDNLKLLAPHGINDLVNLIIRPTPKFPDGIKKVMERVEKKEWLKKWPKLIIKNN